MFLKKASNIQIFWKYTAKRRTVNREKAALTCTNLQDSRASPMDADAHSAKRVIPKLKTSEGNPRKLDPLSDCDGCGDVRPETNIENQCTNSYHQSLLLMIPKKPPKRHDFNVNCSLVSVSLAQFRGRVQRAKGRVIQRSYAIAGRLLPGDCAMCKPQSA